MTWKSPYLLINIDCALVPSRDSLLLSSGVEGFLFSPWVKSSKVIANNAVSRAPEADKENNPVAEKSFLAFAAYEQLNSMESSRLVYLYNLDPPGDPWCRTMNLWNQHCFQWVQELLFILSMLNSPGIPESFTSSSMARNFLCFFYYPFSTIVKFNTHGQEAAHIFHFSIW